MSLVSLVQDPVTGVALSRVERERLGGMRLGIKGKATGTTCVSVNSQHHDPWEEGRRAFCAAAAAKQVPFARSYSFASILGFRDVPRDSDIVREHIGYTPASGERKMVSERFRENMRGPELIFFVPPKSGTSE